MKGSMVVVTGGSSGIGRAIAELFAMNGANLIITYNQNYNGAQKVQEKVQKYGVKCFIKKVDFSNISEIHEFWDFIDKDIMKVDILINNAAILGGEPFLSSSIEHWENVFKVNLFGTIVCCQRAAKIMLKYKQGKILNTSSIRGLNHAGREGVMAYSAAKAALNNFTITLSKELAPYIQVNAVAPGFVYTSYYDTIDEATKQTFIEGTLTKKFTTTEEIAETFLYLAKASSMNGHILTVDGGYSLIKS